MANEEEHGLISGTLPNMSLALKHAANVGKPQDQLDASIYAEDIVVDFPFAPEGHTRDLQGREALLGFLAAIGEFTTGHQIESIEVSESDTGFTLHYTESSVFKSTNNTYRSEIVWLGQVRDNRIVSLREFYNPIAVLDALG